ncbi:PREDICTED: uncharacterized protein LOC104715538 [Camelina sativa]|uniref:Uncharacterized protein LOC104715538 n=1 Tax=Camelina sativa TaxID=90675 RepID=A0ABM0TTP6_CAMSA|nr:PREDICTED: uncharacterized protein LOC104715538 [Camelina sativa]
MANFVFLKKLNPSTMQWMICAKVFRSWKVKNCSNDVSKELILVDEEGSFGHATIPAALNGLPSFVMTENQSYVIEWFEVEEDKEQIHKTNLGYRILFTDKTIIRLASDPIICKPFTNFGFKRIYDNEFHGRWPYFNLIGCITNMGEIKSFKQEDIGDRWSLMDRYIRFRIMSIEGYVLDCFATGCYANHMFKRFKVGNGKRICLFKMWKGIKCGDDNVLLTNGDGCSDIIEDPKGAEFTEYMYMYNFIEHGESRIQDWNDTDIRFIMDLSDTLGSFIHPAAEDSFDKHRIPV